MARYGASPTPFLEDMPPAPADPYGIAKVAAEQLLRNLAEVHGVEWSIAVPHNIIGRRQKYDDPFRNVCSIMVNLMLQDRQPIIYGDGEQQRCFSPVEDCVDTLLAMGESPKAVGEIINIGPDDRFMTINEPATLIAGKLDFRRRYGSRCAAARRPAACSATSSSRTSTPRWTTSSITSASAGRGRSSTTSRWRSRTS
jgi:UDP-glucose 4-epimerase